MRFILDEQNKKRGVFEQHNAFLLPVAHGDRRMHSPGYWRRAAAATTEGMAVKCFIKHVCIIRFAGDAQ